MTLDDVMVLRLVDDTIALIPATTPIIFIHHEPLAQGGLASRLSQKSHRQLAREALPELERLMKERDR